MRAISSIRSVTRSQVLFLALEQSQLQLNSLDYFVYFCIVF